MRFACTTLVLTGALASCRTAQDPAGAKGPPDLSSTSELEVHGSLSTRLRSRWRDGESDHQLREIVSLDVANPKGTGWSAALLAEATYDVDGREPGDSSLFSLDDTNDHALEGRVYEAHADWHGTGTLALARLGRQSEYETPESIWFDGVQVKSRQLGSAQVELGLYGGVPVRFYEASEGDRVIGGFASARPWRGARARLDYMHLEDQALLGPVDDDLLALSLVQRAGEHWRFDAAWSRIEEEDRDASLGATWSDTERDWLVLVRVFELFRRQNELALELDPFTTVLLAQEPYREGRVLISKGLGPRWRIDLGYDKRSLRDDDDEGTFNRGFDRAFATASVSDVTKAKLRLSLTGESWSAVDTDIDTWGLDVSRRFGERLEASLGSAYALYKNDLVQFEEQADVRTYYMRLKSRASQGLAWDVRYEFEDGDEDTSSVRMGASWRF